MLIAYSVVRLFSRTEPMFRKEKTMAMSNYDKIPPKTKTGDVLHAIIEIPKGRRNKYEVDKETGLMRLDRFLFASSHYPGDYGFIPQTLAEDGDALDILIMVNEPTFSGCLIEARIIGMFRMLDGGVNDFKILAVPDSDPFFDEYKKLENVPVSFLNEVSHFFSTYKQLEGAHVEVLGWSGVQEANGIIDDAIKRQKENK